jgi:hypothetical protein
MPGRGGFLSIGFSPGARRRGLPLTYEQATLDAMPEASTTPLVATFRAREAPSCTPLAACGTTGTIAISVLGAPRPTRITLTRPMFRNATRARALTDLRAGRLQGGATGPITIKVAATVSHSGTVVCRSTRTETLTATYATTTHRAELVTIAGPDPGSLFFDTPDVLRTNCPGPADEDGLVASHPDLFSENQEAVAQGAVPMRAFVRTHASAAVIRRGAFAANSYAGAWNGTLRFRLRRTRVTVAIRHGGYHEPTLVQFP